MSDKPTKEDARQALMNELATRREKSWFLLSTGRYQSNICRHVAVMNQITIIKALEAILEQRGLPKAESASAAVRTERECRTCCHLCRDRDHTPPEGVTYYCPVDCRYKAPFESCRHYKLRPGPPEPQENVDWD